MPVVALPPPALVKSALLQRPPVASLSLALPREPISLSNTPRQSAKVDEELTIEFGASEFDLTTGITTYTGGIIATYGLTKLYADAIAVRASGEIIEGQPVSTEPITFDFEGETITLAPDEAYAKGNVRIVDPEATASASNIRVAWREGARKGTATNVQAEIGSVKLNAERAEITPELWRLYRVQGTACNGSPPFLAAASPRVDIIPGKRGTIVRPSLRILGTSTPALPTNFGFSLDPRSQGFRLPSLTYRRDDGIGVSFGGNKLPDLSSQLVYGFSAFPGSAPSYGVSYNRTNLAPDVQQGRLTPISDYDERFFYSWFTNVYSGEVDSEVDYLRRRRDGYGFATDFNSRATGRPSDSPLYTKYVEALRELGGPLGVGGYQVQLRTSYFQEGTRTANPRLSLSADYAQNLFQRGRLTGIGRLDAFFVQSRTPFAFAGGEVGAAYKASREITVGGSFFAYGDAGNAFNTLDPLLYKSGFSIRADINTAPTKLSLLARYDSQLRQFDREYRISQVIGCIEPVIVYREYPRSYQIGFKFRIEDLTNLLQRRDPGRREAPRDPFKR